MSESKKPSWEAYPKEAWEKWVTFIQWKGTDVCMDWICPACGKSNHEDRDFMYEVECHDEIGDCFVNGEPDMTKGCGAIFLTGTEIKLYPLDTTKYKRYGER